MPELASYVFKPKFGVDISRKAISRFCDDFLEYKHNGFYLDWNIRKGYTYNGALASDIPEGYIQCTILTDGACDMDSWNEICWDERDLSAEDLTEGFFALLGDDFWHVDEDSGAPVYNFYERELTEVVSALSAENSRLASFGGDTRVWIADIDSNGKSKYSTVSLLDYAMTVPIVIGKEAQNNQLVLEL